MGECVCRLLAEAAGTQTSGVYTLSRISSGSVLHPVGTK